MEAVNEGFNGYEMPKYEGEDNEGNEEEIKEEEIEIDWGKSETRSTTEQEGIR